MAIIVDGGGTSGGLAVRAASKAARIELFDAQGNKLSRSNGETSLATDEGLLVAGVNDGAVRHLRTDRIGSVGLASYTVLLMESFEGTTVPGSRWATASTGFIAAQTNALGIQINSTGVLTASNGYMLKSLRSFSRMQAAPLRFKSRSRFVPAANSVLELGFGDASAFNTINTNGAYWQITSGGVLQPVLTYNGVDITGASVTGLNYSNYYIWDIIVVDDSVLYTVQDSATGGVVAERTIRLPATQAKLWGATRLNVLARVYTTGTAAPTAPSMFVSMVDCTLQDVATAKSWKEQAVSSGYGAGLNPITFAQTANWANSIAPASVTLSNTVASYTLKDGLFQFAAVAGAATDYALFGFQVPAPYSFVCTGVNIDTWNTGAAVATTPTLMLWGLAYDLSAVSLVNAGARTPLGVQSLPIGAVPGEAAFSINTEFATPLITNPGRFMVMILRMPVATATAAQIIQGMVNLRGYFD